jgi:hypothetical protein
LRPPIPEFCFRRGAVTAAADPGRLGPQPCFGHATSMSAAAASVSECADIAHVAAPRLPPSCVPAVAARLPRVAGRSASRPRCSSQNQSRARTRSDQGFPRATVRAAGSRLFGSRRRAGRFEPEGSRGRRGSRGRTWRRAASSRHRPKWPQERRSGYGRGCRRFLSPVHFRWRASSGPLAAELGP